MSDLIYKNLILSEDEGIVKTVRQSYFKLLASLPLPVILIIIPFFFLYPLFYWGNKGIALFAAMLLTGMIWLIRNIVIWYFQTFIITNQRIIDIDKKGLFQKTVSDIPLAKTSDVFYEIRGIWQTVARIGNVYVVLSDSKTQIEIKNISQPYRIQQLILQLKSDTIKEKLDSTKLSAEELVELVKKIKAGIGEQKLMEILKENPDEKIE